MSKSAAASTDAPMELLHCQAGDHDFWRQRRRGAKPANCPEHSTHASTAKFLTPAEEEAAAKAALRRKEQAEARRKKAAEIATHRRFREALKETKLKYPECKCDLTPETPFVEIARMWGCCDPRWVCPRLDALRRRFPIECQEASRQWWREHDLKIVQDRLAGMQP